MPGMLGLKGRYSLRHCMKFCASSLALVVVLGWAGGALGQQTTRFRLDVVSVCDKLPMAWPAWCPRAQAGVAGGTYREIDVSAGSTIEFELHPNIATAAPEPSPYPLVMYNLFVIIPESLDLAADTGCNHQEFLACVKVPFGESPTIRFTPKPGRYKYYDASATSGGYGIIVAK
jgi:hypothetical protein